LTEQQKCPECGSTYLVRDGETGEVVCRSCGVVVGEAEYAADFVPASMPGAFSMVSGTAGKLRPSEVRGERYLRMVGRREGDQRTEAQLAGDVTAVAWHIGAGQLKEMHMTAMWYGKRLLKSLRKAKVRMRIWEVAAVAVWHACKLHGFRVSMEEYERTLGLKSLYKLIVKASGVEPAPTAFSTAESYVNKIASKLNADPQHVNAVAEYAISLCREAEGFFEGKDPVCVATTAMCVADELLGARIGRKAITEALDSGYSPATARILKMLAPPRSKGAAEFAVRTVAARLAEVNAKERRAWLGTVASHKLGKEVKKA